MLTSSKVTENVKRKLERKKNIESQSRKNPLMQQMWRSDKFRKKWRCYFIRL